MRTHLQAPFLMIALTLAGCGSEQYPESVVENSPPLEAREVSPEEMALQLGFANEPRSRTVKSADFGRYPLVVDIFRRSSSRPVLGPFEPSYVDLLTASNEGSADERLALAKTRFTDLAGREMAIVSLNGAPYKAQIISAGLEGYADGGYRTTPPGNYKLDIIRYKKKIPGANGAPTIGEVDYPWLRSEKFGNSIMYWGLWIFGGYFIHSTTHYGKLGKPASMGCIRQTYPDAMELFQLRQANLGMIRIHPVGSVQAIQRLREIGSPAWALPRLAASLGQIRDYVEYAGRSEIAVQGHAWIDPATGKPGPIAWPDCGPVDCFKIWGRKPPVASFTGDLL